MIDYYYLWKLLQRNCRMAWFSYFLSFYCILYCMCGYHHHTSMINWSRLSLSLSLTHSFCAISWRKNNEKYRVIERKRERERERSIITIIIKVRWMMLRMVAPTISPTRQDKTTDRQTDLKLSALHIIFFLRVKILALPTPSSSHKTCIHKLHYYK